MVVIKTGYPSLGDEDFRNNLVKRSDYQLFKSIPYPILTKDEYVRISKEQCSGFEKTLYQHLMQHYLSIRSPYRSMLLYHAMGSGKCHAKDTTIIMYDGTIKMVQDIEVGDLLMGDDSTPRKVLSLANGYDDMYDVIPIKGEKYTVNSEHILCLKPTPRGISKLNKYGRYIVHYSQLNGNRTSKSFKTEEEANAFNNGIYVNDPVIEIAIKDYIKIPKNSRINLKGYRVGIDFKEQPLLIDPYLFGIWLGNNGAQLNHENEDNFIQRYDLEKNKYIPHVFLANSRENRIKLLAGLIDADGCYLDGDYEIIQKSDRITKEILYLARSLGFAAYSKRCEKKSGVCNRIYISGDVCKIPVLLPHNIACDRKQINNVLVTGINVKYVGRDKYYGFTLDGNNRYLLGDFTVTHNTCSSITIAEALLKNHRITDEPSIYVVSTGTLHKSYEEQIFSLSHKSSLDELREQCTSDHYLRLIGKTSIPKTEKEQDALQREIHDMIKKRYKFITYHKFANKLIKLDNKGKLDTFQDKVIIIDEAHNLRDVNMDKSKALTEPLIKLLRTAKNNRLVLLSATPMYNEPDELLWLLSLLCINDKRKILDPDKLPTLFNNNKIDQTTRKIIEKLSSEYVSYIRGNSPFTFPLRVSPGSLGISLLNQSITDNEVKDPFWPTYYKDGLVPTPLGSMQREALENIQKEGNIHDTKMKTYEQIDCIAINGKTGKSWISEVFDMSFNPTLNFKYKERVPLLMPTEDLLGTIACKIYRICEFIKSSTGIVVVYSNYNWSGILPIALALEHVGFERYGGSSLLNSIPTSKEYPKIAPYRFQKRSKSRYTILSGNKDLMKGSESFINILNTINSSDNKDGDMVKVVLITPVASEGLTIKNAREIHILSPWYNINNLEQVIGRTIRTCSHILKPIEERNVTVYMHTTVSNDKDGNSIDTADLHSYRISARKLFQMNEIVKIIRDNAWDCSLMKNLNYIPKNRFDFSITMKTSQGTLFNYTYGDTNENEPNCKAIENLNIDQIRPDMYMDVIPTLITRLRKYVVQELQKQSELEGNTYVVIHLSDIPNILRIKEFPNVVTSAIRASLEKDGILSGYRVFIHMEKLYVVPNEKSKRGSHIGIRIDEVKKEQPIEEQLKVFEYITNYKDDDDAIVYIYSILYDDVWREMAYKIIETPQSNRPSWLNRVAALLHKQGALIHRSEYPSIKTDHDYIGYYDFFQKNVQMYILGANKKLREASDIEIKEVQKKREVFMPPKAGDEPEHDIGIFMIPRKSSKDTKIKLVFKILKKGVTVIDINPGTVCISLKVDQLNQIWKESLKITTDPPKTKADICNILPSIMLKKNRLYLPPVYKPYMKK